MGIFKRSLYATMQEETLRRFVTLWTEYSIIFCYCCAGLKECICVVPNVWKKFR